MTDGYRALKIEWSLTDASDKWADTMEWWFAIAETLYHNEIDVPVEWEFRDSPCHDDDNWLEDDSYLDTRLNDMLAGGECTKDDLLRFGEVMNRYANLFRLAGKDR